MGKGGYRYCKHICNDFVDFIHTDKLTFWSEPRGEVGLSARKAVIDHSNDIIHRNYGSTCNSFQWVENDILKWISIAVGSPFLIKMPPRNTALSYTRCPILLG